ncbi:Protein of unknown function [Aliiruegeria lutimaris]|uniref:DUF2029 domain-containing protein n=2 Tax=Aliiruegeria lutimaris TaxID=571298 RepID=A0A1G9NS47_9RHOB|nr:Protein of unknown function [Aliiruegeria lutimaris]
MATELEHDGQIFPYLYPPIWAALIAPLTAFLDFDTVERIFNLLNPLLLVACSWLAWRALRSPMPALQFIFIGQILYYGTTIGGIAVLQNQPQIIVAFLTLLTIERSRADAQIAAGAALALAAAIKLYPVLYAPILLARGQTRAFLAFLSIGCALGLTSIVLAGWPLHVVFLDAVAGVANTVMRVPAAYGLDTVLAWLLPKDGMNYVTATSLDPDAHAGWYVMSRPLVWSLAIRTTLLACLALSFLRALAISEGALYESLWPATIIALALLSPLAWCYYFIAPLAFAPSLLSTYGRHTGTALLLVIALLVSIPLLQFNQKLLFLDGDMISFFGFVSMLLLLAAFGLSHRWTHPKSGTRNKNTGAHRRLRSIPSDDR